MAKAFIVWNLDKSEGVVFASEHDARNVATGSPSCPYPAIAAEFLEHHDPCSVEQIEISQ